MNNRYLITLLTVYLLVLNCIAQDKTEIYGERSRTIDSLNQAYITAVHDTEKINCLFALGEVLIGPDPDTVLLIELEAMELAEKNLMDGPINVLKRKYLSSLADALNNIGYLIDNQGDVKKGLEYYLRSLEILEEIGDKKGIASSLINIGYIYENQGDIAKGLEYYFRSLAIKEDIGDKKGVAISLNNIGYIYENQGEIDKGLQFYERSLQIEEELERKQGIAISLNNIGAIYRNRGDNQKGLEYYLKSLEILEEIGDKKGVALSLNNIAGIYVRTGEIMKGLEYYLQSFTIREGIGDKKGMAESLDNIGGLYLDTGQVIMAKEYGRKSMALAKEIGFPENIKRAALLLSKVHRKQGDFEHALEMYELYIQMRDSIKNKETQKSAIRQQTKYEFEKALLIKEQEEKEIARLEAEVTSRRDNLQYSVILIALLILFGGVLTLGFVNVSERMAEGIIFFSFLIFFEFLLVLADPYIENWSGGAPGIKLLFNGGIAALIFPAHAFFESKLKSKLEKK